MSGQSIQKTYYDQLSPGHYLDVRYSEHEWKIARVLQKDKRYATIAFDALNTREQAVMLHSTKTAPLRGMTQDYTGAPHRPVRHQLPPFNLYQEHMATLSQIYLKQALPSAFVTTQYLRGEFFVLAHSLLARQELPSQHVTLATRFLTGLIDFVIGVARRTRDEAGNYFKQQASGKWAYLVHEVAALVESLSQLLWLLNIIVKAESHRTVLIFKKGVNQQLLIRHFVKQKAIPVFADLMTLSDGTGRWLPLGVLQRLYFLLKREFIPKLPVYEIRDYVMALGMYRWLLNIEESSNRVQEEYLTLILSVLCTGGSFEAQLRCLAELRKVVQGEVKLYRHEQKKVFSLMASRRVLDHLLSPYHFNPQIFKRYIPILKQYSKVKPLNPDCTKDLFKLAAQRHQSEVAIIHEIICQLAEFMPTEALDTTYATMLGLGLHLDSTLKLLVRFTLSAVANMSSHKGFIATLLRRPTASSKYHRYALDLFLKEVQDGGKIGGEKVSLVVGLVGEMLGHELLKGDRQGCLQQCLGWLEKGRSHAQALQLIDCILNTYPPSAFFSDNRRQLLLKLCQKQQFLDRAIMGLSRHNFNAQPKANPQETLKCLYSMLEHYMDELAPLMTLNHIELLWSLGHNSMLADFLKRTRGQAKKRYVKRLSQGLQYDILTRLVLKHEFVQSPRTAAEFQALDQIWVSLSVLRGKGQVSQRGIHRYIGQPLECTQFYFRLLPLLHNDPLYPRLLRRTILTCLRPRQYLEVDNKVKVWKGHLIRLVESLKPYPLACLTAMRIFFQMTDGNMSKDINNTGNVQIGVVYQHLTKNIALPRSCTLWRLRKQIMKEFSIAGDFWMYSLHMKRDITFAEEEEYSLNALPLQSKGPSISIAAVRPQMHPHIAAVTKLRSAIEREEGFFKILFGLNVAGVSEYFWGTVQLLPVNRGLVERLTKCDELVQGAWDSLLLTSGTQGQHYHLTILYDLLGKVGYAKRLHTSGATAVLTQLIGSLLKQTPVPRRTANKCLMVILRVVQQADVTPETKQHIRQSIVCKLESDYAQVPGLEVKHSELEVQMIDSMFKVLLVAQGNGLALEIMLNLVRVAVFQPRNKASLQLVEGSFQHYLVNRYPSPEQKQKVLSSLLSLLVRKQLAQRNHCQLLFAFLIDYLNTFIGGQQQAVIQGQALQKIQSLVLEVLASFNDHCDPSSNQYNHLLHGSLRLLLLLVQLGQPPNPDEILPLLLKVLLQWPKPVVQHPSTSKMLYEALKKILFYAPQLVLEVSQAIGDRLRTASWRTNSIGGWSLEARRQNRTTWVGLQNQGATCYINSLVQQLFMTLPFRQQILSVDSRQYCPDLASNESYQLQRIFAGLKHSSRRSLSMKKFTESFITYEGVPINPMQQSDADEFFNALMEKLETFLKGSGRHDILQHSFQGTLSNQLICEECPHRSQKEEVFLSVGVEIRGKSTLQQALQGFVEGQVLAGNNAYLCQPCQKRVRTTKRLCFDRLPRVLVIVIKRFEFNFDEMRKIKLNTQLRFPFQLDMTPYTAQGLAGQQPLQNPNYSLSGAVIHSGTSQAGHYHSLVRNNSKWYSFNDQIVEEINVKRVEQDGFGGMQGQDSEARFQRQRNAYMLFYTQQEGEKKKEEKKVKAESQQGSEMKDGLQEEDATCPTESRLDSKMTVESEELAEKQATEKAEPAVKEGQDSGKMEQEEESTFARILRQEVEDEERRSEFLSVMLDDNFMRLCQNLSALQHPQSPKLTLLYFHTAVLRDRSKEDHLPHYYRIIHSLLGNEQLSQWYLEQIHQHFLTQFVIESTRTVRYSCTGLLIRAVRCAKQIPQSFILHTLSCLSVNGITPFALLFGQLAKREETKKLLVEDQYPIRAVSLLLRSHDSLPTVSAPQVDSYFGKHCSEKAKQLEQCPVALMESLECFEIELQKLRTIYEMPSGRRANKIIARKIVKAMGLDATKQVVESWEEKLKKDTYCKQDTEKYMFLLRSVAIDLKQHQKLQQMVDLCVASLGRVFIDSCPFYDPTDQLLRQFAYIASRSRLMMQTWRKYLESQNGTQANKALKQWLKEAQQPHNMLRFQDYKRKTSSMSLEEKHHFDTMRRGKIELRTEWMWDEASGCQGVDSDLDAEVVQNRSVQVRNRTVRLREELGLIKKVEFEAKEYWAILDKNEIDLYPNL